MSSAFRYAKAIRIALPDIMIWFNGLLSRYLQPQSVAHP